MPWRQLPPSVQQQYGNGNYGKGRGMRRGRPGSRIEERGAVGNANNSDRRQSDHDGGDWYKEHDREKGWHRERERHWNERDRHGGDKRRRQEYTEHAEFDRRGRARSRSQSRDDSDDDHPRRRH